MKARPCVIGIDGGATKTLGVLADPKGNPVARFESGPSNHLLIGEEQAAMIVAGVLAGCCERGGCAPKDLSAVVAGLAGAGAGRQRLIEAIGRHATRVGVDPGVLRVETDARIALEGAFAGGAGIVVIAGTGSVVIGKKVDGTIVRCGGWGRVLGDEGSGYAIGREAIRKLARDLDGVEPAGALRTLLMTRPGIMTREEILQAVYTGTLDLSTLAPAVLKGAEQGDTQCLAILESGARSLAELIATAAQATTGGTKVGLAMLGGLIDHESVYSRLLADAVGERAPEVAVSRPLRSAVEGAVLMALRNAQGGKGG